MEIVKVPIVEIFADPSFNCRGHIAPIDVVELARSIDTNGLQQAISIQPYGGAKLGHPGKIWRVILGHRRFEAFKLLDSNPEHKGKYSTIPCTVQQNLSELDARVLNFNENLERKDLNIMQEAKALTPFINAHWTQQEIATRLNQSTGWVQVRIMALRLEPEIQNEIAAGFITQQQIKDLLSLSTSNERFSAVRELKDAKIRGEKTTDIIKMKIKKETKQQVTKKAYRLHSEILKMQAHIQETIGNNFGTRCLAWAAGEISDMELFEDIAELAKQQNKYYEIPVVGLAALDVN